MKKKYRNNLFSLSLNSLSAFLHLSFIILLQLEVSTSTITTTSITYSSIRSLSSVRQATNETSVQERFFVSQKRESPFLDVDVVVVSSAIEYFTCSCLCVMLCVCVCVAGRYCFRLIATVVVDFSLLLFTNTCRSFSFSLFYCQKKKSKQAK